MSVAFDISPPNPALSREDVRRGLAALLRRRVPGQEVEDLVQTILCDALAAGSMPADPEELRRWLVGIARHKIADYHRRAMRTKARSEGDAPLATCASSPAAFEEREVLHRLLGEARSRRDAETMEWLVREHGGDRLADIAEENGVPAPVVRQRVSRLRRALRSRWAMAVGLLVILASAAAFSLSRLTQEVAIAPDRAAPIDPPASAKPEPEPPPFVKDIQGEWVVQAVRPDRELTPAEQKIVDTYAKAAKVHVENGRITLHANAFTESWTIAGAEGTELRLVTPRGEVDRAELTVRRDAVGPRIDVRIPGHPRLAGTVTLRRPIY